MAAHAANDSDTSVHRPPENSPPSPTERPTSRIHSPEFEKRIDEVQSRLRAFIEATRPAHEAYLRTANRNSNPASKAQNSKEKTMSARTNPVTHAKHLLRASANATKTNTKSATRKSATRKSAAPPQFLRSTPDLARHRRKCTVCHHPEREAIEDLFVHWHSPEAICNIFNDKGIGWIAVYRHAYALGLDEVRRRNLRFVFEHILDQADQVTPTPASLIAAARALGSCVNDTGQWHEPPRRVLVTNIVRREIPPAESAAPVDEPPVGADRTHRPPRNARQTSATTPNEDSVPTSVPDFVPSGAPSFAPSAKGGIFDETPEPGREIRNSRNSHIRKESQISNR
jgi:hypothetical protein